eukprot:SAG31_NODE_40237_length_282_cov_0.814208_1_plen_36_part_10
MQWLERLASPTQQEVDQLRDTHRPPRYYQDGMHHCS